MRGRVVASQPANGSDLVLVEFACPLPISVGMPTLGDHVGHVFCVRTQEEMGRVRARPIVAAMQDVETCWDRSIGDLECKAMCVELRPPEDIALWIAANLAVAIPLE